MLRSHLILGLAALTLLTACGPKVRFSDVTARRVQRDGDLEAISFTSSARTSGLAGQQLVYEVRVLDARMRPVRSVNDRFRNAAGEVAAAKVLMVFDSPWPLDNVTIAIPVEELEVAPADMPAGAEFALRAPGGEVFATAYQRLPLYEATIAPRLGDPAQPAYARRAEPDAWPPAAAEPPSAAEEPPGRDPSETAPGAVRRREMAARPPEPEPQRAAPPEPPPTASRYERQPEPQPAPVAAPPEPATAAAPPDAPSPTAAALYAQIQSESAEPARPTDPATSATPPWGGEPRAPVRESILSREAPSESESRTRPRIYVVQQGDTLTRIARRIYGDSSRWIELFEFNRHQLDSPDLIYEGLELLVPPEAE